MKNSGKTPAHCRARILLFFGLIASGCGYTSGYRLPEDVSTLAVPIFRNDTFPLRREIEYDVTRAVRQELEARSDVRFTSAEEADAVLNGTITRFQEGVLSEGRLDVVQESDLYLSVRLRLTRRSDGAVLFDREVADHAAYSTFRGQTLDDARREAVGEIARRLVAEMEAW